MNSRLLASATVGILFLSAGCASTTPPPTMQAGPNAEVTVDGLYRMDNSVMAMGYMKPDLDLRHYTKIMLDPVTVAYQKDPGNRRSRTTGQAPNFALRPSQMDDLKSWFQEAVVEALTEDDGYEMVETPAPDVLLVTVKLIDLIVRIPTQNTSGRSRSATSSYGEVTLIVEVRDSETGEILARAADRQDPTRTGTRSLAVVSSVFVKNDTVTLFRHWAELMRQRLDEVRAAATP
jgi:hypothetical protein